MSSAQPVDHALRRRITDHLVAAVESTPLLTDPNAGVDQRTDTRTYLDMLRPAAGLPSEAAAEAVLALLR